MAQQFRAALFAFIALSVITGGIYPLVITVFGQALFPVQANGSLIIQDGQVIGSALLGQVTDDPSYFWSRPSAANAMQSASPGALVVSGATNYGWTNATLASQVAERADRLRAAHNLPDDALLPPDLLFASASGLDPHISPEAAALQIDRVAQARGLEREQVETLVAQHIESPQFGVLGRARVNVLLLNLALDTIQ
jgi:K+-transporting ATPase ATPase C chain